MACVEHSKAKLFALEQAQKLMKMRHFQNFKVCWMFPGLGVCMIESPFLRYVTRVRHIVGEEESMRTRRKMRFADKSFSVSNPGPEFPRSWTSGVLVEG